MIIEMTYFVSSGT